MTSRHLCRRHIAMWLQNYKGLHALASHGVHGSSTTQKASRYLFSTEYGDWYEGRDYCQQRGYHLVEIDSPEEQGFLTSMSPHAEYYIRWIGAIDANTTGLYVWHHSGSAVSYTNWYDVNHPSACSKGRPCCISLNPDTGTWHSDLCDNRQMVYICEK